MKTQIANKTSQSFGAMEHLHPHLRPLVDAYMASIHPAELEQWLMRLRNGKAKCRCSACGMPGHNRASWLCPAKRIEPLLSLPVPEAASSGGGSAPSPPIRINSANEADVRAADEPLRLRFERREPMTTLYPHCMELASNESWWDIMLREPLYTAFYEYLASTEAPIPGELLSLLCEQRKQAAYYASSPDATGTLHFTIVDTYHSLTPAGEAVTPMHTYESDMRACSFREVEMVAHAHAYAEYLDVTPPRSQLRRVAKELATLSRTLPISSTSAAAVRISSYRPNFISFLLTGAMDTPYAYGCFIFDVYFPAAYPNVPPKCRLRTTGNGQVRFNPHIYKSGNICLSLIGTHPGPGWDPEISTCLQLINSIQALLLIEHPWCESDQPMSAAAASSRSGPLDAHTRHNTMTYAILEHLHRIHSGIVSYECVFDDAILTHFRWHKDSILAMALGLDVSEDDLELIANL